MPQTTTHFNACNVSIWLDNAAGALQNISGSANSLDVDLDLDVGRFKSFGSVWPARLECGKDATFTLKVCCSRTANEAWDIIINWFFATPPGARTFDFYMPDKNVGSDYFSCEARLDSGPSWTADPDDPDAIIVTATLVPDGEVAYSTSAT